MHHDHFNPKSIPPTSCAMFKLFIRHALPSILINGLAIFTYVVNVIFAARLNDSTKLAAVGLANVCTTIMISGIFMGLSTAQEILAA